MRFPHRWLLAALLGLSALLTIGTAGWGDLYNETDGQYSSAAKTMAEGGSWLIPENNGLPRLVKPPLLYWAMAAAMKVFGINEFAARLPGALGVMAWTAVTFLIGARMGGPWRGFLAGGILLTSLGTFTLGKIVMPETAFAAFLAAALYCALRGVDDAGSRRFWYLGFWLCASLASFTKGWHGLLYPLAIVGLAALFSHGARPQLRGLISWPGAVLFLLINVPWYLFLEARFPGYLHNLVFTEQLGHVTGSSAPATSYTDVPRWQFVLLHGAWFFPWSLVAGVLLVTHFRKIVEPRAEGWSFPGVLVLSWAVVIFTSVLLTGERQDYYAMAMWPAFALGAAALLERFSVRVSAALVAGLLLLGLIASFLISPAGGVEAASVAERATAWTTVSNFGPQVWLGLRTTAWAALGGGFLFAALAAWAQRREYGCVALLGCAACLDLGAVSGTSLVSPYFSLASVAPEIRRDATPQTHLIYDGGLDTGSSLLFYTDLPLTLLDQAAAEDFFVRKFGMGREKFISTEQMCALWRKNEAVVFVTEISQLPRWQELLGGEIEPVARSGTQIVLRNH